MFACAAENGTFYTLFENYKNHPSFNFSDDADVEAYVCDYIALEEFQNASSFVVGIICLFLTIIGFPGQFLILGTISRNKNFKAKCFWIHRIAAALEIIYTPFTVGYAYGLIYRDEMVRSYALYWFCQRSIVISNVLANIVDLITKFLSIERAIATLLPTKFYLVDRWRVFFPVFGFVLLLAGSICVPNLFAFDVVFDPIDETFKEMKTNFGESQFYKDFDTLVGEFFYSRAFFGPVIVAFSVGGMLRAKAKR